MEDIELVVKVDEESYKFAKELITTGATRHSWNLSYDNIVLMLANGIPLPKGHGRLIDESKIKNCGWNFIDHHAKTDAPTIIEADRETEE